MAAAACVQPPDLSNAAKVCMQLLSHVKLHAMTPARFERVLGTLAALARAGSWRLRGGLLPFVGTLAYRAQFVEPAPEHTAALRATLHTLMCDSQHEVREATGMDFVVADPLPTMDGSAESVAA